MAMKLQPFEIFEELKKFSGPGSNSQKANWLKQHDSPTLRLLLKQAFDPKFAYDLPPGEPPYNPNTNPLGTTESSLYAETRKLSYLWNGQSEIAKTELTDAQQAKVAEGEAEQAKRAAALKSATDTATLANDEVLAARNNLEEAKKRLATALSTQQTAHIAGQTAKTAMVVIDDYMKRLHAHIAATNAAETGQPQKEINLPKYKREMMFTQILESIPADDAKLLLAIKNKTLTKLYPIVPDVVNKAFPGLLPAE